VIFSIATALAVTSAAFFLQPQQTSPAEIGSQRLFFRGVGGEALVFKWLVFICSLRVEPGVFPTTCGIEKPPIPSIIYCTCSYQSANQAFDTPHLISRPKLHLHDRFSPQPSSVDGFCT
jgi:hypothetical protein